MKVFFLFIMFWFKTGFSQEPDVKLTKIKNESEKGEFLYRLKIFNSNSNPLGVKCSITFNKFSENDTLDLAIGDWYTKVDSNYFYSIDRSETDARISESGANYQLLVINPQTYSIFYIKLIDYKQYPKAKFLLSYTNEIRKEDQKFIHREEKIINVTDEHRFFIQKIIPID